MSYAERIQKTKDLSPYVYKLERYILQNIPRVYVSACRLINVFTLIPGTRLFGCMAYHILARPKERTRLSVKHSVARYTSAFM